MPPRLIALWLLLGLSAVLLVGIIAGILRSLWRQDLARLEQESSGRAADLARQVEETIALVEVNIASELAGFHLEGLRPQLAQWSGESELVAGVFVWNAGDGQLWSPVPSLADSLRRGSNWVWEQPEANLAVRPLNPSSGQARYLADNLEILSYDGDPVEPVVGWARAAGDRPDRWICWHRLGPGSEVRGCLVEAGSVLEGLRAVLRADPGGPVELLPEDALASWRERDRLGHPTYHFEGASTAARLLAPYVLRFDSGKAAALARYHRSLWWFAGVTVLLFLLGVVLLIRQTRREMADAQRRVTFVSQVSHELRTPLTSIRMFSDMLDQPELPEEKRHRFARTIARETQRLTALVERLLSFNRLEKGNGTVRCEQVEVAAIAKDCLEQMQPSFAEAGMQASWIPPAGPVFAWTDREAVQQALLNVLDNARKYAASGREVRVSVEPGDREVRLVVADRGPGIPRHLRERVFEPFVQGAAELHTKTGGLGLGLSISRSLLRAAGGDLRLVPSSAGATFHLHLPRAAAT